MARNKIHSLVQTAMNEEIPSSPYMTSKKEAYTVWMKSLVMQGNGCTVYNKNGDVVYRIDNYEKKCRGKFYLMDLRGKILYTICQRRFRVCGRWDGYKYGKTELDGGNLWFQVRKRCNIFNGNKISCQVMLYNGKARMSCYNLQGLHGKSAFMIMDSQRNIIAEVNRKQSSSGVYLGDDVLSLLVEAHIDHSLIVALVAVYGSICRSM